MKPVRLTFEAECSTCGPLPLDRDKSAPQVATDHTSFTGHVVILRGTTDSPAEPIGQEEEPQAPPIFYVDIPTLECVGNDDGAWQNVASFPTRKDAVTFAREQFGADSNGCVSLVIPG